MPEPPATLAPELARRLGAVADRIGHGIVLGDAGGCVEWANPAFERITGRPLGELLGKRLDVLAADGALDRVLSHLGLGEPSQIELRLARASGERVWIGLEVLPLEAPGEGFVGIAVDLTEGRQAVDERAESEDRWRQLVELCPDAIGVHSEGRWVFLNRVAARLLGADRPEDVLGRPVLEFVHPSDRAAVASRIERVIENGDPAPASEIRVKRLDGTVVDVEIAGSRVTHAGRPAVQLVAHDLAPRLLAERKRWDVEARQRDARNAETLAGLALGVGHDMSNLLGTILGEADLALAECPSDAGLVATLQAIRRESLRGSRITSRLLSYAGRESLALEAVDVSRLVIQSSEALEATLADRALLDLDLAGDLPAVAADPKKLRQLLVELVQNAGDAVEADEGSVTLRTGPAPAPGGDAGPRPWVRIEVSDTGCGMDRATLARALDPCFTTRPGRRGLGLAAAQGIVRAHRGRLRLTSRRGVGTTVEIRLPCTRAGARRRRRRQPPLDEVARSLLLVEDEDGLRSVARRILEHGGYEVREARDGREAVRLFRRHAGDIGAVILDVDMPEMGGAEALRQLRLVRPDVRVVLTTGCGDATEGIAPEDLAGFLAKPYEASELLDVVRRALAR